MVHGSKKKRAHPETSTPALASISPGTFTSPATTSKPPTTLTSFPQLPYSSPKSSYTFKKKREVAQRNRLLGHGGQGLGKHTDESRLFIEWEKYQELKANAECFYIETDSPMLTDEQFMLEVVGGSNKGYVYGFGSQYAAINVERQGGSSSSSLISPVSSAVAHDDCIEREKRL
ncbi:hypothetical protein M9H77_23837 [Catharanthus roseus]|uniref:Uncharacterized protein n=1 Tax=Catharanthus roseus TaxID=4058 RepID=A0ACC0AWL2_CATRO|nr:hypothetical protein M9H77_23837 [Catharanthus roseus]